MAGDMGERYKKLSTVEVMDTETLQWSTASRLPHTLNEASATLCGDQVYMLGGGDQNNKPSKVVIRMDDQSQYSPAHWLPSSSLASHSPWEND